MLRIAFLFCLLAVPLFFPAPAAGTERAMHVMFKGAELYSWKDTATGAWHFSLLPGTNRNKTTKEIKAASQAIMDTGKLKQRLALLAVGEQIFWSCPDPADFALPPAAIIDEIVKFATANGVNVSVLRSTGRTNAETRGGSGCSQ